MSLIGLLDWVGHLASIGDAKAPKIPSWVPVVAGAAAGEEPTEDEIFDAIFDTAVHPIPGFTQAAEQTKDAGKKAYEKGYERSDTKAEKARYEGKPVTTGKDGVPRYADGREAELTEDGQSWQPKQ